jgi:hypothetical protein
MKQLLDNVVARIRDQLSYLRWVGVLDDPRLPPKAVEPPFVGVKDNGVIAVSLPGRKDDETLSVIVVAYQALYLEEHGAAVMGSPGQLGETGKGLLEIADDIKVALNDNLFTSFSFAHRDRLEPSQTIDNEVRLLSMQRSIFSYRRVL